jgi:hypothetical protein
MGDVSRHRDIFLASRDAVPDPRLGPAGLTRSDLTYVELGNYLTDVSQFRDPVTFIFTKRRIWRDKVIPRVADKFPIPNAAIVAIGAGVAAATKAAESVLPDWLEKVLYGLGGATAAGGLVPYDAWADLFGADNWIDAVLGLPMDQSAAAQTAAGIPARDLEHYGLLGAFFVSLIEGVTHYLFAAEVRERNRGPWGRVEPIPQDRLSTAYAEFFTQYWPHEHTDQPPYVWDAGKRPKAPSLYGESRRGRTLTDIKRGQERGVMNVVDAAYVPYLAEGLSEVEDAWRGLRRGDSAGRQRLLVRVGKLLHGVEDWYFHSNVVELLALTAHRPRPEAGADEDAYLRRFVDHVTRTRPEFRAVTGPKLVRLRRKLYRRLRFPVYTEARSAEESGGVASTKESQPCLRHAYPAFPSQQDTANTLLPALEHLGAKLGNPGGSGSGGIPDWAGPVVRALLTEPDGSDRQLVVERSRARGVDPVTLALALAGAGTPRAQVRLVVVDVLREWVPLILIFLDESERQRLVANVAVDSWPLAAGARPPGRGEDQPTEIELQQTRHEAALKPRPRPGGVVEDNYARLARHLLDAGFLNEPGRAALAAAFAVDRQAEQIDDRTPGCGNLLLEFAVEQQKKLDEGEQEVAKLDRLPESVFGGATDNGAFQEIVGSHSLMSKDTTESTPFFDDARVLATVASNSVLTILLEQVGAPRVDRRLDWEAVLRRLIRFPPENNGWERRALALFAQRQQAERQRAAAGGAQAGQPTAAAAEPVLPTIADIPELAGLAAASMRPVPTTPPTPSRPSVREQLEEAYRGLEVELREFRHP